METKRVFNMHGSHLILEDAELEDKYLTFWSDDQLFAISIADVMQIMSLQPITPMPELPSYAKGIIQLREQVLPVIDMRLLMERPEKPYNERTCIIVVSIQESLIGLIVDGVDEVSDIRADLISAPPMIGEDAEGYLAGIGRLEDDKVVLIVEAAKLLGGALHMNAEV